jgi:hypothetical protein
MKIITINHGQNAIEVQHSLFQSVYVNGVKVSSQLAWREHRFRITENGVELDCKLSIGLSHGISFIVSEKPVVFSRDRTFDWLFLTLLIYQLSKIVSVYI